MTENKAYNIVTLILKRNVIQELMNDDLLKGINKAMTFNARGVKVKSSWKEALIPLIHPEMDKVELLVPEENTEALISKLFVKGKFHQSGAGMLYSQPCDKTVIKGGKHIEGLNSEEITIPFQKNLVEITCIVQRGMAQELAQEVIKKGKESPVIQFGTGRGVRDRMGIVRIAVTPEKEYLSIVCEEVDASFLFDLLIKKGNLHAPGQGFIYMRDLGKGILKSPTTKSVNEYEVELKKIIHAIDELKGNTEWRHDVTWGDASKASQAYPYLENLERLVVMVDRGKGEALVTRALDMGVPGATIGYGWDLKKESKKNEAGIAMRVEQESIEMILSPQLIEPVLNIMHDEAEKTDIKDFAAFTQKVPRAFTYIK